MSPRQKPQTLNDRPIPKNQEPLEYVYEGQWVRCSRYTQGHRVARELENAICGRPVLPKYHAWVVEETRKTAKCAECARGDDRSLYPDTDDYEVYRASQASRLPVTREARQEALLTQAKVALLRREFGAKEI